MASESRTLYAGTEPLFQVRTYLAFLAPIDLEREFKKKVGVFARFMTYFAFRCRVSLQKETGLLPVPRVFLHFHMPTQLFQLGRHLPVTRRRTVRKSIREKQFRAKKLGRRGEDTVSGALTSMSFFASVRQYKLMIFLHPVENTVLKKSDASPPPNQPERNAHSSPP